MATEAELSISRLPEIQSYGDFPKTEQYLWDKSCIGKAIFLNISHYRKPKICISEKVLQLLQHQCEHFAQASHRLIGTLVVEDDREGVQFQIDRFDTNPSSPLDISGMAPGDVLIPFEVTNNIAKERCGSIDSYVKAFNVLQERCCSKRSIELSDFLILQGSASFYSNSHASVSHLDIDMITIDTVFKAVPITPIPIVLTALSKNLAGPMSLSHMQGTPKTGYLTMDHTRKLLLVLESDPKTSNLPVIGIWVSGVEFVQHPFVWAACLRYIHNANLTDRVCLPPDDFLLIIYSPLHSRPEFYQCVTNSGNTNLDFELFSGYEVANIVKALSNPSEGFTEFELRPADVRSKMEMFDAAKAKHSMLLLEKGMSCGMTDDIEPRSAPTPHMEKVQRMRPMVPDVSVLWTDSSEFNAPPQPFKPTYSNFTSSYQPVARFFHHSSEARTMPNMQTPIRAPITFSSAPFSQHSRPSGGYGSIQMKYSQKTLPFNSTARAEGTKYFSGNSESVSTPTNPYKQPFSIPKNFQHSIPSNQMIDFEPYPCNDHYRTEPVLCTFPSKELVEPKPAQSPWLQHFNARPSTSNTVASLRHCVPAQNALQCPANPLTANHIHSTQQPLQVNSAPLIKTYYTPNSTLNTVVEETFFCQIKGKNRQNESNADQSRDNHPGNNTNSSGSNDDDSGLSATPEKINTSQPKGVSAAAGEKTAHHSSSSGKSTCTENVKWDQVPADIRALLIQQNDQIRQLQQQIQMLLLQQQAIPLEDPQGGQTMSNGTQSNTPRDLEKQSKINQMSPSTHKSADHNTIMDNQVISQNNKETAQDSEIISQSKHTRQGNQSTTRDNQSNQSRLSTALMLSPQLTTSTSRNDTIPKPHDIQLTAKARDDTTSLTNKKSEACMVPAPAVNVIPQWSSNDSHQSSEVDFSQDDLAATMESFPFCEQSVRSTVSDLIVDMPDYASSYIDRSHLDQSLTNVSQFYQNKQDDSCSTLAEDATDPRQYYSQLMNNIQLFLTNSANCDLEPSVHVSQAEASLETFSVNYGDSVNATLAQQINYVSMLLGCGSSADQSVEIRNMAFKYLPEDQLPEIAKLFHQEGDKFYKKKTTTDMLQRALSHNRNASSTHNSALLGLSPCNMTIATKRYLAKHGLLGNDMSVIAPCNSEQVSLWEVPKLKTDFSILTARGEDSTSLFTSRIGSVAYETSLEIPQSSESVKKSRTHVFPPVMTQETAPLNNENWLPAKVKNAVPIDLGASPVLPAPRQYNRDKSNPHYDSNDVTKGYQSRNVMREVKGQGFQDVTRQVLHSAASIEDENILDIAKLKQLPKLL
ncbi:unnamed protein product [Lymnaea stagnalis]|uniref:STIL N-terminal domain-containing protein n=1 Tax=Lymnaea stagnalis TaxID=6523 RepID=A0AAV2HKA5_LYMST